MLAEIRELNALRGNRRLRAEPLAALRLGKLRSVLHNAYEHVPFYRTLWREAGVSPDDLRSLEDLSRWPIITRQQLKRAGEEALTGGKKSPDTLTIRTSGSTGDVLEVKLTPAEHRTRLLIEFRTLLAMGFRPRDKLAIVGPAHGREPHWHERLGLFRTEILTMDLTIEEQIAELRRIQPTILWAYPDCLRSLLQLSNDRLSQVIRPRIVITSAAVLPEGVGTRLREDLGCEFYNSYASMETGRLAAECPAHQGLHVNADHVMVECTHENGLNEQGRGVVIVTALNAFQMPLIRYRLGDLTRPLDGSCPCGCEFPRIEAPVGRADDVLVLPSGRRLGAWQLVVITRGFEELDRFRFLQHARDRLELQAVVPGEWSAGRQDELRRQLLHQIEESVDITIRQVEQLEESGVKFRTFFSEVR